MDIYSKKLSELEELINEKLGALNGKSFKLEGYSHGMAFSLFEATIKGILRDVIGELFENQSYHFKVFKIGDYPLYTLNIDFKHDRRYIASTYIGKLISIKADFNPNYLDVTLEDFIKIAKVAEARNHISRLQNELEELEVERDIRLHSINHWENFIRESESE